jgi:Uma2 family endonuclease
LRTSPVAPDWACEVLSPSTRRVDRVVKMPIYRRENVRHVWLVDPEAKTLEVFRLDGESYRLVDTFAEDARVRAEPFDAIELELGALWLR